MSVIHHHWSSEDPESVPPVTVCSLCGGALYDGDLFYAVNGLAVCEDCLPAFAREEYRSFRMSGREWRHL